MGGTMDAGRVTQLLRDAESGADEARAELLVVLRDELRRIAAAQMHGRAGGVTLQPTALVHEAYLRLFAGVAPSFRDRSHFLAAAATAMRSALVDAARRRHALRRGGDRVRVTLDLDAVEDAGAERDVLDVHDALARLEEVDADWARVVELRFFGGLTVEETAATLGVSEPTVYRMWDRARAWLWKELAP